MLELRLSRAFYIYHSKERLSSIEIMDLRSTMRKDFPSLRGILLYDDCSCFEYLEGDELSVSSAIKKRKYDVRFSGFIEICKEPCFELVAKSQWSFIEASKSLYNDLGAIVDQNTKDLITSFMPNKASC